MKNLFIVIPAYNEGTALESVIKSLLLNSYTNIIIVDDASTDNTEEIVKKYPVYYTKHRINRGQGAALRTGTEIAIKLGAELILHFDADGQMDVDDISKFLKEFENDNENQIEIILGSRFFDSKSKDGIPKMRRVLLFFARIFNWIFLGINYNDPQNGFRMFRSSAYNKIIWQNARMAHCSEILQNIKRNKVKYKELAVNIKYNQYSMNKGQSAGDALKIVWDLFINKF